MKKCVFAGTFDPPTTGHKKIIEECLKIFDEVVVAVMINTDKKPLLTEPQREELLQKLFQNDSRVKITVFSGAVVDLLEKENTPFYVRGVRNALDFEYENQNHFANKKLKNDIVTVYIPSEQENIHISSTLVRNSLKFKKQFKDYIPKEIYADFVALMEKNDV